MSLLAVAAGVGFYDRVVVEAVVVGGAAGAGGRVGGHHDVAGTVTATDTAYRYDGHGQLTTVTDGDGVGERWWWDRELAVGEPVVTSVDGVWASTTVFGPAGPLTRLGAAGGWVGLHNDPLGSTVAYSDPAGVIGGWHRYGPYGTDTTPSGGFDAALLRYAGGSSDATTGLYFFKARWMDPATGGFLSPDPIRPGVGQAHQSPYTCLRGPHHAGRPHGVAPRGGPVPAVVAGLG